MKQLKIAADSILVNDGFRIVTRDMKVHKTKDVLIVLATCQCGQEIYAPEHLQYLKRGMCWNCTPGKKILDFCFTSYMKHGITYHSLHHEGAKYVPMLSRGSKEFSFIWFNSGEGESVLPMEIYSKLKEGRALDSIGRIYTTFVECARDFRNARGDYNGKSY